VVVLGAAYRGNVKEAAFSGVFPVVAALAGAGARAVVHDPLFSDDELVGMGLTPGHLGEPCDGALVQADHDAYRELRAVDLPGVRAVVDGRGVLGPDGWHGVEVRRIGDGRR